MDFEPPRRKDAERKKVDGNFLGRVIALAFLPCFIAMGQKPDYSQSRFSSASLPSRLIVQDFVRELVGCAGIVGKMSRQKFPDLLHGTDQGVGHWQGAHVIA